jgi:4-hydroxy-tetrahydrodipicolinate synthase
MELRGVIAASITPINPDFSIDLEAIPGYLDFLASRGCHGALLLGTTGEGPSFSITERKSILEVAIEVRKHVPGFFLLAGTGMPSLEDTIQVTRFAFELGYDAVVVLPPYYFRKVTLAGLLEWFRLVIERAVPEGGKLLGYHIPPVSGVPLPINLLQELKDRFPDKFAGIKDSSGDADFACDLDRTFGKDLQVFTGNDFLFSHALKHNACGCITSLANLTSPLSRQIWEGYRQGQEMDAIQEQLSRIRNVLEEFPPAPAFLKSVLHSLFAFPDWAVYPPLDRLQPEQRRTALQKVSELIEQNPALKTR